MFNPLSYIKNAYDYARCIFQAKGACYQAIYLEQEVRSIGEKVQVNVRIHPVQFAEDDEVTCLPNYKVVPDSNIIESDMIEDLMFDRKRGIAFLLEARLYGSDNDKVSVWDIRKNRLKRVRMLFSFIKQVIYQRHQNENVKLGSVMNYPPVAYKDLHCFA